MEPVTSLKDPKECLSARNVLWYLVFTGFAVNYMIRLNLNIAIVSMIRPITKNASIRGECDISDSGIILQNNTVSTFYKTSEESFENTTLYSSLTTTTTININHNDSFINWTDVKNITQLHLTKSKRSIPDSGRIYFDWNEKEQGHILGSYFWLHWITQIPGGILGAKYGTKTVFGLSNFLGIACCYLIPWFAHRGTLYLIFIRCLQGLIVGFSWPSVHSMTSKWIPPNERSNFVTAYMGSSVGAAITYPLCGFIINRWGWEMVFYTNGVMGTIWFIAWWCLVHDTPSGHPRISDKEKEYILASLGKSVSHKNLPVPWKAILTDNSVWANVIAQVGGVWGLFTLMVNSPSYFKFIHGWNIQATGLLSGMPHFFRIIFAYLFSMLGDYLLRSNKMKRTNVRKFATIFCCGVQGIFTLALAYSGCNKLAAIIFMSLAVSANGAVSTGPLASLVDISPNYSSILLGICNTLVSIVGFCTPAVVGYFTFQNQTTPQWQKVFALCTFMLITSCIYYLIFAKSNLAHWNTPQTEQTKHAEEELMVIKSNEEKTEESKNKEKSNTEKMVYTKNEIY